MLSKPKNPPSFAEACIVSADKRWKGGLIATTGDRHDDERTVHHRYHLLIKIYFHGSSVSTPARSEIVQMQREPPGTVMAPSIVTARPPEWIRNPQ
jgi:hypothetical protein